MSSIQAYQITSNGWHPISTTAHSADELTRQLPQGFYTTFRTLAGGTKVIGLTHHLSRLYQPAQEQAIQPDISVQNLRDSLRQLAEQSSPTESRIRVILTASSARNDSPGTVYAILEPFQPLSAETYLNGVHVVSLALDRDTPRLKSTSFIEQSQSARQLVHGSIFEVLLIRNGHISEGMTSNFFYVENGKLGTARKNILLGVTRRTVLRVGRGIGLEIIYRPLQRKQVSALDEAFLTSSSRGVVPIVQVDETKVGEGVPGSVTNRVMTAYNDYILRRAESF